MGQQMMGRQWDGSEAADDATAVGRTACPFLTGVARAGEEAVRAIDVDLGEVAEVELAQIHRLDQRLEHLGCLGPLEGCARVAGEEALIQRVQVGAVGGRRRCNACM